MTEILDIRRPESIHLDRVYSFMTRTLGIKFIQSSQELEKSWDYAQIELSKFYQYEGVNEHIWDYYLIFCCQFGEGELDKKIRFKIEADRFCCRKFFVFNATKRNFSPEKLVEKLFPEIKSSNPISLISANDLISGFQSDLEISVPPTFLTNTYDKDEVEEFINSAISVLSVDDEL